MFHVNVCRNEAIDPCMQLLKLLLSMILMTLLELKKYLSQHDLPTYVGRWQVAVCNEGMDQVIYDPKVVNYGRR